jgi:microcystin-dependent protein
MADPFLAEVRMFGFNFAPRGWATCDGQILPLSQNTALFSLLGTTYGGNGQTTFALPNLASRFAIGAGQGPGLAPVGTGESGGEASHGLTASEVPSHKHGLMATSSATTGTPSATTLLANTASGASGYRIPGATVAMSAESLAAAGGNAPHENRQPYLGVNFCIALQGIFPARN